MAENKITQHRHLILTGTTGYISDLMAIEIDLMTDREIENRYGKYDREYLRDWMWRNHLGSIRGTGGNDLSYVRYSGKLFAHPKYKVIRSSNPLKWIMI